MNANERVLYSSELAPSAVERQDFRHVLLFSVLPMGYLQWVTFGIPVIGKPK